MEKDCAPSEGVVSPSKMKDKSTTDPCEPETHEVEYPETEEDICSVFSNTIGVTSCSDKPMVLSSPLKPCFQSDPGDVLEASNFFLSWKD